MIRLIIFLLLAFVLYKVLRPLIKGSAAPPRRPRETSGGHTAELVQDPQCGAYILPAQSVSVRLGGKVHHFCSERCKEQFLAEHSGEAGGKSA
jgi:YHS domain-containing protein